MHYDLFKRLSLFGAMLALCVVVLGAYVRLSDAGLGCPDWPGCYGALRYPKVKLRFKKHRKFIRTVQLKWVKHGKKWHTATWQAH